jgi:succinyl-CoA synthetase beta subunit
MRLFEFESKNLLKGVGLTVPQGIVITREQIDMLDTIEFATPWYLKAQVPVGGRGKAGAIIRVNDIEEARAQIISLFEKNIKGYPVKKVLIEEEVVVERELYLSLTVNRQERTCSLLAGTIGGIDVEEVSRSNPETILNLPLSPLRDVEYFDILAVSRHLEIPIEGIRPIVKTLCSSFSDLDAELIEFNPLAVTKVGLVILDAKIIIDDNALFRHPDFSSLPQRGMSGEEAEAARIGLSYVSLDGNIGIIGNGAGLTMATMDLLKSEGGQPANFLDMGAGATAEKFKLGLSFLLQNERISAVLVNIFGGLTRCDEIAKGMVETIGTSPLKKPIVVRFAGTNEIEGRKILQGIGVSAFSDPLMAIKEVVTMVVGGR